MTAWALRVGVMGVLAALLVWAATAITLPIYAITAFLFEHSALVTVVCCTMTTLSIAGALTLKRRYAKTRG